MRNDRRLLWGVGALLVIGAVLVGGAYAGCNSCTGGGSGGTWSSGLAFIGASPEAVSVMEKNSGNEAAQAAELNAASYVITARALFEDQNSEAKRLMAYVGVPQGEPYIEGSIHLPLDQVFTEDGTLKSPAEIAGIFGAAGISEDDPLVLYGDYFVNGYDTFAFWVMKYLGHEDVVLLEGTKGGREAAGLKFVANPTPKAAETYSPNPDLALLATDDQLAGAQLIDARSPAEYDAWHMEGATNVDSSTVMGTPGLGDDEVLSQTFSGLDETLPVVVYSGKGGQASIDWYALYIRGYDASLYTLGNQS